MNWWMLKMRSLQGVQSYPRLIRAGFISPPLGSMSTTITTTLHSALSLHIHFHFLSARLPEDGEGHKNTRLCIFPRNICSPPDFMLPLRLFLYRTTWTVIIISGGLIIRECQWWVLITFDVEETIKKSHLKGTEFIRKYSSFCGKGFCNGRFIHTIKKKYFSREKNGGLFHCNEEGITTLLPPHCNRWL